MQWRWVTISPELNLTLTLDSDDPELIRQVEYSAEANKITLVRLTNIGQTGTIAPTGPPGPPSDLSDSLE